MKKLFAFSFFIFHFSFLITCFGQDTIAHKDRIKSFSIVFGQGKPLSSFSFNNATNKTAYTQSKGYVYGNSFADPGGLFNVEFNIPIKKSSFGFIFDLGYNGNGFDDNSFHNFYEPAENLFLTNCSTSDISASTVYSIVTLMPGITYTHNFGKLYLSIKALAGALLCVGPDISYWQTTSYNPAPLQNVVPSQAITQDSIISKSALSLCMEAGLEAGYQFWKKAYFIIGCDYLYADPVMPVATKTYFDDGGSLSFNELVSTKTSSQRIPITLLNIYAGFKFLL